MQVIDREELLQQLIALLKKTPYTYELKSFLKHKGIEGEEADELIKEAREVSETQGDKKRRIIWAVLAVATFVLFYFLIPNGFYNALPLLISAVGGGLTMVFVVQIFANFKSFDEISNKEAGTTIQKLSGIILFVGFIILTIVYHFNFDSKQEAELSQYGIQVKGIIVDGSSTKRRRGGTTYEVTVAFKTKEGKQIRTSEDVTEEEFNALYKGLKVDLIYSSKNPKMIELLTSKFTDTEVRDITTSDLLGLMDKTNKEVGETLNAIKYGWNYSKKDSLWSHDRAGLVVMQIKNQEVRYLENHAKYDVFKESLLKKGFSEVGDKEDKRKWFESPEYIAYSEMTMNGMYLNDLIVIARK